MKLADHRARALLGKLQRLADPANGGTPDEIAVANRKLQRLRSRYDFTKPDPADLDSLDIFAAQFSRRQVRHSSRLYAFDPADFDIANSVKWAIEQGTGIPCSFQGGHLSAAVTSRTAEQLAKIALHISQSFKTLVDQFGRLQGVTPSDRRFFVRGLYDGMMNAPRGTGERLPGATASRARRKKTNAKADERRPQLAVHPYTVAMALGRQIRFATAVETITAELDRVTRAALEPGSPAEGWAKPDGRAPDAG
jgi:hypothetical protein